MKRELIRTSDGSATLRLPEWNEQYHSVHGALQESMHVYIHAGLHAFPRGSAVHLLEVGFGTGLNALLTWREARERELTVYYEALEPFPLHTAEWDALGYGDLLGGLGPVYRELHTCPWDEPVPISPHFTLRKRRAALSGYTCAPGTFNLVYFDAFAPRVQPELWTVDAFRKIHSCMAEGGVLVTYCARGEVKRNMRAAGFRVERLPGPPGKREMTRAIRETQPAAP